MARDPNWLNEDNSWRYARGPKPGKASTSEGKEEGYDEVAPYVVLHNAEKAGHRASPFIVNVDWEWPAPESGKTQELVHRPTLANQDDPDDKEPDQTVGKLAMIAVPQPPGL